MKTAAYEMVCSCVCFFLLVFLDQVVILPVQKKPRPYDDPSPQLTSHVFQTKTIPGPTILQKKYSITYNILGAVGAAVVW